MTNELEQLESMKSLVTKYKSLEIQIRDKKQEIKGVTNEIQALESTLKNTSSAIKKCVRDSALLSILGLKSI